MLKNIIKTVTPEQMRKILFRRKLLRYLYVILFFIFLGWGVSPWIKIGFNGTNSIDGYVFLIVKSRMPDKGELAAFWPPENEFYKNIWFVKYVKGVNGDFVQWNGNHFYINGKHEGVAKTHSKKGIALEKSYSGTLGVQQYFLWTPHKDSFDSRYSQIGWIHESNIIGTAYLIF